MYFFFALIAIILSLLLIVGVHEAGHALVARLFHVKIKRISIGFGKPLLSWKNKDDIEWVWARWPLGGYVQLLNTRITPVSAQDASYCFDKKPCYVRILILIAGALANIIMAWLALVLVFMMGYKQVAPIIDGISIPSIAATAGLKAGDNIISIAGDTTSDWRDVGMQLIMHLGESSMNMTVERKNGAKRDVQLDLDTWRLKPKQQHLLSSLGIKANPSTPSETYVHGVSFIKASQQACHTITYLTSFFFIMIKQLVTGILPLSFLLGPLGLFTAMAGSFMQGLSVFLYFIASLSLAVAVVNLLPIPGLDGGSILYTILEKIRGKPISVALEILLYRLALIAFYVCLVQLIINDLERLWRML
jgi:regulator of sigma E protease